MPKGIMNNLEFRVDLKIQSMEHQRANHLINDQHDNIKNYLQNHDSYTQF